jgi:5-methylcytosine-specific restriction endonuclease McrA
MADTTCPGEPGYECIDGIHAKGLCRRCYTRRWRRVNPEKQAESVRHWAQANREKRAEYNRRYRAANREKHAENVRRWRQANPEKDAAIARRYREANRDRSAERTRRYYEANREERLEYNRRYREANREKAAKKSVEYARQRRARKAAVLNIPFTTGQLAQRMSYWGNQCWMCGGPFEHVDHVIPLALGGPHVLANLRPACASCNTSKGAKDWRAK